MTTHRPKHPATLAAPAAEPESQRLDRLRQRPDGYHWIDVEGRQEFGPFDTPEEALADMEGAGEEALEQADLADAAEQGVDIEARVDRGGDDGPEAST